MIVEDHPDLRTPLRRQPRPLKVKGAHPQTKAVGEHDGERRIDRPDLPDGKRHTIGRGDHVAAVRAEQAEVLPTVGIVVGGASREGAGYRHPGDAADRGQSGRTRQPPTGVRLGDVLAKFLVAQRLAPDASSAPPR
jgi:hypothetical protein